MSQSFAFRNVSQALPDLLHTILAEGARVPSRGGEETLELRNVVTTLHRPTERYCLTPGRRVSVPAQIAETMWVLSGRDDVGWLRHYLPRAADFSDDGVRWRGAYGPRLRAWGDVSAACEECYAPPVDQLRHVVELLREDPETRRALMVIYDPTRDSAPGKDIPCNNWLHFLSRGGALDLQVTMRSNDVFWGWSGINTFEWSVLLELVAGMTGLKTGSITFFASSLHLYDRHWKRAEAISRDEARDTWPRDRDWILQSGIREVGKLDEALDVWFGVESTIRETRDPEKIRTDLQRLRMFPLFYAWAQALAWWWTGDESFLAPLHDTSLEAALRVSPGRPFEKAKEEEQNFPEFRKHVADLHAEKHASYGDSWKRRGEMMGIMANVARKVDRLGRSDSSETSADTALDLWVYCIKYRLWMQENYGHILDLKDWRSRITDEEGAVRNVINTSEISLVDVEGILHPDTSSGVQDELMSEARAAFEEMERTFPDHPAHVGPEEMTADRMKGLISERYSLLATIIRAAGPLAAGLWTIENSAKGEENWKAGNATRFWQGYDEKGTV